MLCILTLLMSIIVVSSLGSKSASAQVEGCKKLSIPNVSTNRQVNVGGPGEATRAIDSKLDTRWIADLKGSYIQADLGKTAILCSVDIAWFKGDSRTYNFVISVSDNGQTFRDLVSGKSTGTTAMPERYNIPDTSARYLRVTVQGNSDNSYASIFELSINGRECSVPQISGVRAIGNDGNVPQNTLDNNLNTRWSNLGFPSWIQYDLGQPQPICDVDVAWYRGNLRVNTFTISVSSDGINFTPIFSGQSSGKTTGLESYNVPDTMGQYMRITVTGNNENSWSSITEVRINGGATPTPTPTPTPGGTDPFGIEKIYPTIAGGEEWFMDMSDGQDARSDPPDAMTKNSDGSFKVQDTQVRFGVFTTSGYNPEDIELDHGVLAERGYMQSPNDWKNVEMGGYVKVNDNSVQDDENFAFYARGGRHTGSGNPEGCEGVAYKGDLSYDGTSRFAKEQWHVSYVFSDRQGPFADPQADWVGFKTIMWNVVQPNGETIVKMENWVDANEDGNEDGPWERIIEVTDDGGWGSQGGECGGEPDQIITWGGPMATFRWDGANDVDIKNLSVREIQPPS